MEQQRRRQQRRQRRQQQILSNKALSPAYDKATAAQYAPLVAVPGVP
jgi:hypothetical protein